MTVDTTETAVETTEVETTEVETPAAKPAPTYEKGSWQAAMQRSAALFEKSGNDRKRASSLLWSGAQSAIADWADNKSEVDVHAEVLYADVLDVMGESRKGDVSKIKTVALAVAKHGLVLSTFANLSKAYSEARRLIVTVKNEEADDSVAEDVVEAIAAAAPKTASTAETAAQILLAKGIDGAVVAILDALNGPEGKHNEAAHRSFMRAVSTEVSARVQANKPKPEPKAATPKAAPKAKAAPATKAKPAVATKAKPAPVSKSNGDPNKKALPAKAKPVVKAKPAPAKPAEQATDADDMFDALED